METYQAALDVLPERFRKAAAALPQRGAVSEFRLRCGRKATALLSGGEQPLCSELVSQSDLQRTLELCSGASPYAAESLRLGYLTARCGVRVGFCGEAVEGAGRVKTLKGISSAAIRIPREVYGCAAGLCDIPFASTLILSPPGIGKTTLLRDMIRLYSRQGLRVALADERGEVAALWQGKPGFDLGDCTDVISGGRKSETTIMLLRSMAPDILAMDEITAAEDLDACSMVSHCGVGILATAHAAGIRELSARPLYRELMERHIFRRAIVIQRQGNKRLYREAVLC